MRFAARILYGALALATITACGHDGAAGSGTSTSTPRDGVVWQPPVGTTWQWQLAGLPIDTSVNVDAYDVDLFTTTDKEIAALKAEGRSVICYFSAGSWEEFRPDAPEFSAAVKRHAAGRSLPGRVVARRTQRRGPLADAAPT